MEGTERIDEGLSTTGGYAMIPGWVAVRLAELGSCAAWYVYYEIARRAAKKRFAWPSQQRIASDTGIPLRTVEKAISDLKRIGAVAVAARTSPGKGKQGNTYTVVFEQPQTAADCGMGSQPAMDGGSPPATHCGSVYSKDEVEEVELQKIPLPIIPLTQSSLPELPLAESVRDLPFPDREQSASDTAPIENKLLDRTQPLSEAKALRATEPVGEPDPEWAAEWHEYLALRRERKWSTRDAWQRKTLAWLRTIADPKASLAYTTLKEYQGIVERGSAKPKRLGLVDQINGYLDARQ